MFENCRSLILQNVTQFGFTWCFLMIRFRLYILGKNITKAILCSHHCILWGGAQTLICPITHNVPLIPDSDNVCQDLPLKVTSFKLCNQWIFWGNALWSKINILYLKSFLIYSFIRINCDFLFYIIGYNPLVSLFGVNSIKNLTIGSSLKLIPVHFWHDSQSTSSLSERLSVLGPSALFHFSCRSPGVRHVS